MKGVMKMIMIYYHDEDDEENDVWGLIFDHDDANNHYECNSNVEDVEAEEELWNNEYDDWWWR